MIIVVDDESRENEGDCIAAAEKVTPEMINFMATNGRGLICAPLTETRCEELDLDLMVGKNTVLHNTQFTVSVDLIGNGCTTGISAHDRAKTVKALTQNETKPEDLGRPGHIFPLRAKDGGVLRRTGHTEAAIDLAMHRVAEGRLGVPQSSRDAFILLEQADQLTSATATAMKNMVGFRNVAVHSYQQLQLPILESILAKYLGDFETFLDEITHRA